MVIPISDGVTTALRLPPRHRARSRSSRAQRIQGTARLRPAHRGQGRRRVRPVSTSPTPRPRAPADPGYLCESWSPPGDAPACTQYGRLASLGRFSCTLSLFMPIWKPFMAWMAVCALAGLSKLTKPGETRGTRAWVSTGPPRPGGGGCGEGPCGPRMGRGGAGRGGRRCLPAPAAPPGGGGAQGSSPSGPRPRPGLVPPTARVPAAPPAAGAAEAPGSPIRAAPGRAAPAPPRLWAAPLSRTPSPPGGAPAARRGSERRPPPTRAGPGTSAPACGGRGRTHLRVEEFIGHCPP